MSLTGQIGSAWQWSYWIDLEKDINCYLGFRFFIYFRSEYLKQLQKYDPAHTKMNPASCLLGSRLVYNPFFLLAGALLFDEKICQMTAQFWLGLRDVRIIHSQAVIQRTIFVSPTFLEHGSAKKIAVCAHTNRHPNKQEDKGIFVFSGSELWTLFKY
jgi:hypothetical protein